MRHDGLQLFTPRRQEIAVNDTAMTLTVEEGVPRSAKDLIWEEFFRSRGRGVDWVTHLPWAVPGEALCVSAAVASGVVAAMLVRRAPGTDVAMIGYVCVAPAHRGQGLSGVLLDLAAAVLASSSLRQMVLWTGKPGVYEGSGFTIGAQEQRLVLRAGAAPGYQKVQLAPWPEEHGLWSGLPPYAKAAWRASSDDARIVFVDTPGGAVLLEMRGEPDAIVRALVAVRPSEWSATLDAQDPLYGHIISNDLLVDQAAGPVTMHRPLGDAVVAPVRIPLTIRI